MAESRGLTPSTRVLSVVTRPADLDEAEALRIAPGSALIESERLRLLDGEPTAIETLRIPHSRAASSTTSTGLNLLTPTWSGTG